MSGDEPTAEEVMAAAIDGTLEQARVVLGRLRGAGYWLTPTYSEQRRRQEAWTEREKAARLAKVAQIDAPYVGPVRCQAEMDVGDYRMSSWTRCGKPAKWLRFAEGLVLCGIHHRVPNVHRAKGATETP